MVAARERQSTIVWAAGAPGRRSGGPASGSGVTLALLELEELWESLPILVAPSELLRGDDVVEGGEQNDDVPDLETNGPLQKVGVRVTTALPVAELDEQVERAGVSHPGR